MTLLKLSLTDFFATTATVCRDQMLHCFLLRKAIRIGMIFFCKKKKAPSLSIVFDIGCFFVSFDTPPASVGIFAKTPTCPHPPAQFHLISLYLAIYISAWMSFMLAEESRLFKNPLIFS